MQFSLFINMQFSLFINQDFWPEGLAIPLFYCDCHYGLFCLSFYDDYSLLQKMSYLVVDGMQHHGTNFLMQCVPKSVEKCEDGKLLVKWQDGSNVEGQDMYDTVMMAIGEWEDGKSGYVWHSYDGHRWVRMGSQDMYDTVMIAIGEWEDGKSGYVWHRYDYHRWVRVWEVRICMTQLWWP